MLSEKAKQARRDYKRQWRAKNKEHVRAYQRQYQNEWRKRNKDKVQEYNRNYWERKAVEMD